MSTGSIIVVVILVVFGLRDSSVDAVNATSSLMTTLSPSTTQPTSVQSVTPTTTTSAGGAASVTSSPSVAPTEAPRNKTCGNIKFMVKAGMESMYTNETALQNLLERGVFNESSKYNDVNVSGLTSEKKEEKVEVKFKLCVVLKKNDVGFLEDMLKDGFKYNNMEVTEFEFTGDGVSFKDWKAKDDECSKCSDGGAGPIVIEGTCVPEADKSCNGLKTTDKSTDCVKYCDSSAAAIMMSSFILAMGILVSFSFNIWK